MSARRYGGVTAGVPANFSVRYQSQTKEHWARNLLRWTLIDDERRFGCRDKVEIQLCIYCVRVVITFHLWQNRFYFRQNIFYFRQNIFYDLIFYCKTNKVLIATKGTRHIMSCLSHVSSIPCPIVPKDVDLQT